MSVTGLLSEYDGETPRFSFTKADRDMQSNRDPLDSVTVQGVTVDGTPFGKSRIPLDDDGRVVISRDVFGDDAELAWLVANLLEAEGWEYVET